MVRGMWLIIGILVGSSAGAADGLDLKKMADKYGYRAVYTVIQGMSLEDRSAFSIQSSLREAGLDKLQMPVTLDPSVKEWFRSPTPLTSCGWNWEVHCQFTAVARRPVRTFGWDVRCVDDQGEMLDVPLTARVEASTNVGETANIQVTDMGACWEQGGVGVKIVLE